jgi:hypothetical protein
MNALHERTSARRHGEVAAGSAQLFEISKGLSVRVRIAAKTHSQIVAAVLAFSTNASR